MTSCPNQKLSKHRENIAIDNRGRCRDCGRQLSRVVGLHGSRYGSSRRRANWTNIEYEGAPIE